MSLVSEEFGSFHNTAEQFSLRWQTAFNGLKTNESTVEDLFNLIDWEHFEFASPAVLKPYIGEPTMSQLILMNVKDILEDFTYTRAFIETGLAGASQEDNEGVCGVSLIFEAWVTSLKTKKRLKVEGCDFFKVNSEGKAIALKVMIRPYSSLHALREIMMEALKKGFHDTNNMIQSSL